MSKKLEVKKQTIRSLSNAELSLLTGVVGGTKWWTKLQ